jgi:hypothetical protein
MIEILFFCLKLDATNAIEIATAPMVTPKIIMNV